MLGDNKEAKDGEAKQEKQEKGFMGKAADMGKGAFKDKAKSEVKKKIWAKVLMIIAPAIPYILLALTGIILITILVTAFLDFIDGESSSNASAANGAFADSGIAGIGEDLSDTQKLGLRIAASGDRYEFHYSYTPEEIEGFRTYFRELGIDQTRFTEFEIVFLMTMANSGLDLTSFTTEELKCLPLFYRAEFATQYLDLRPVNARTGSNGEYIPVQVNEFGIIAGATENQFFGTVQVHRSRVNIPIKEINNIDVENNVEQALEYMPEQRI